jgi:CheY-like chemotaxis protein
LKFEGYLPEEAENGRRGVELAKADAPDLIICDIMMPELDGFEVLQALRESPATASLPFIFLTAKVESSDLRQGMNLGADDYLTKPFRPEELLTSVRQRLKRRQQQFEEVARRSEEVSLAVASTFPLELAEPIDHIDTLANLMVLKHGAAVPQLADMQRSFLATTLRMRRMVQRLNLYAQLPQLYAHRFGLERTGRVEDVSAVVARESSAIAAQWERQSDLQLSKVPGNLPLPLPLQESYLVVLCQEIVENACKFSPAGTPISITSRIEKGHWILEVTNHGPGLRPTELANLGAFKQFWNGERKPAGLGLGLVLAQGIVRLHAGEMTIASQPMETTCVRIQMPLD